jgi:2-polyprenyl-6-methoxyphenol hydroxylase-like FAD-dependent oxidoreductase
LLTYAQSGIVGAGLGGPTTAIALRKRGIDTQVSEKIPILRDVGEGIAFWPNAVKVLRKLSLDERLAVISLTNIDGAIRRGNGNYGHPSSQTTHSTFWSAQLATTTSCLSTQLEVAAALKTYETRRIKRTTPIVLSSRRIGAFAQVENALVCTLRDTAVRLTPDSVTYRSLEPVISYTSPY